MKKLFIENECEEESENNEKKHENCLFGWIYQKATTISSVFHKFRHLKGTFLCRFMFYNWLQINYSFSSEIFNARLKFDLSF